MDINYRTKKLRKLCNSDSELNKKFGDHCAKKIKQRLDEMKASDNMAILMMLPSARCHPLKGGRRQRMAHGLDLKHPLRMIIEPDHNPVPLKDDGGLDYEKIIVIQVVAMEDYHG